MQTEHLFLQDQIAVLRKRLNIVQSTPQTGEKPPSAKLHKAYEIRNKVVANLRKQLVEMIGREDTSEMIEEAERDAEVWWSMQREGNIEQ